MGSISTAVRPHARLSYRCGRNNRRTKPCEVHMVWGHGCHHIWFGDSDAPKPYEFMRSATAIISHTPVSHSFGSSPKLADIGPDSFGLVVCRFVGTVLGLMGLALLSFRPKYSPNSKIPCRILASFRGFFSAAELGALESVSRVKPR